MLTPYMLYQNSNVTADDRAANDGPSKLKRLFGKLGELASTYTKFFPFFAPVCGPVEPLGVLSPILQTFFASAVQPHKPFSKSQSTTFGGQVVQGVVVDVVVMIVFKDVVNVSVRR